MKPIVLLPLLALLPLAACKKDGEDGEDSEPGVATEDADSDGFSPPADCDDGNAAIHPEATETCGNGVDDNCDGLPGDCRLTGVRTADEADVELVGSIYSNTGYLTRIGDLAEGPAEELIIPEASLYDGPCASAVWVEVWPYGGERVKADEAAVVVCSEGEEDVDLGQDVAIADLDQDGHLDLLAAMPMVATAFGYEGYVGVWYGPLPVGTTSYYEFATHLHGGEDGYLFGSSVATGDFDDDGVPDVAVGAAHDYTVAGTAGAVYTFRGPLEPQETRDRLDAEGAIYGTAAGQYFGSKVLGVPDMDGDGADELYVGSPAEDPAGDNAGVARVFRRALGGDDSPSDAALVVNGTAAGGNVGWIAASGDLDGDGAGDLVIGDGWSGTMEGAALVWFGPMSGEHDADPDEADAAVVGTIPAGHVGTAVGVADVDGDGQDDLMVHGLVIDGALDARGALYVYYGPITSGQLELDDADLTITGVEEDGWLGYGEPTAGDLDGDGNPDLVVAAPLADEGAAGSTHGVVYVFRGQGL